MPWNDGLDEEQGVVASHMGLHARVLAGPGTGKTYVMVKRIAYLIEERRVRPTEILALTFTRHAAAELRQRVIGLIQAMPGPRVSTLHSFALRQLLRNWSLVSGGIPEPLRIADDYEERYIVIDDLKKMLGRNVDQTRKSLRLLSADWETLNADRDEWERQYPDGPFLGAWREHSAIYGYTLRAELVYRLKRALEEHPSFRLEGPPRHLLVDEYQDLNRCDLAVVRALADRGAELFAAGDDDQSIYGFRYAYPEGIRSFDVEYQGSRYLTLTLCRRCDPAILQLGLFVANQDYQRIQKPLQTEAGKPEGEVQILRFQDQYEEASTIASMCRGLVERNGYHPHDILILVRFDRYGAYSSVLRQALDGLGIPVSVGAEKDPFGVDREGRARPGRQLLALAHIAANQDDHLAWRTFLELRRNGIGDKGISSVYQHARSRGVTFCEALKSVENVPTEIPVFGPKIAAEVTTIRAMARQLAQEAEATFDPSFPQSIADGLRNVARILIPDAQTLNDVLDYIVGVAEASGVEGIQDLVQIMSSSSQEIEQHLEEGKVNVLTMHKAKGLTAKAVFVVAAEDELIPGFAQTADEIGDERRLLYVSLTRARHFLFITRCVERTERQAHTGRNSGRPSRTLTRFLQDGPLRPVSGPEYAQRFASGAFALLV